MKAIVRFSSFASLHKAAAEQLSRGSLYIPSDLAAPQFAPVDVELETPDGERFAVACEVLQAFPGMATALTITAGSLPELQQLLSHVAAQPATGDAAAVMEVIVPNADDSLADQPPVTLAGEAVLKAPASGEQSLVQQLAAMSVSEKRQAALHGGKDLRTLILKELNKMLHPFVLRNPAITPDEVEAASKMTSVNPEVLHLIAKEWTRSSAVVRNLVKNPKTPMNDALALIDKLALSDVRAIVKSNSVRMPLLMAARKRLKE